MAATTTFIGAVGGTVYFCQFRRKKNMPHTNPKFKIVQVSTNITYNIIIPQSTKKFTYNKNIPRKKSQKTAEIEFEDSQLYRA